MGKKKAKQKKGPEQTASLILAYAALVGATAKLLEVLRDFPW